MLKVMYTTCITFTIERVIVFSVSSRCCNIDMFKRLTYAPTLLLKVRISAPPKIRHLWLVTPQVQCGETPLNQFFYHSCQCLLPAACANPQTRPTFFHRHYTTATGCNSASSWQNHVYHAYLPSSCPSPSRPHSTAYCSEEGAEGGVTHVGKARRTPLSLPFSSGQNEAAINSCS